MVARICRPRGGGRSAFAALRCYVFQSSMRDPSGGPSPAGFFFFFLQNRHSHCSPARHGGPSPPPFRPGRPIFMIFWDFVLGGSSQALPGLDLIGSGWIWMIWDALGRSRALQDAPGRPRTLQISVGRFGTLWDALGRFGTLWDVLWRSGALWDARGRSGTLQDAPRRRPGRSRTPWDAPESSGTLRDAPESSGTF